MSCHRIVLLLSLALILIVPTFPVNAEEAENSGASIFQTFVKVPPIAAEFWGEDGFYHGLDITVTLQCSVSVTLSKKLPERIRVALTARPWEDYAKGNPAKLIKTIIMGEVQKESYGAVVEDVLITNLLIR